ncbi:hypothetical protein XBJ2_2370006 [Xenorhabdus bovienii str. Jollieti]|nr:hypothetical protein XBJ2_2370006 [Xenorhabdus bovienii str. Jollieti]
MEICAHQMLKNDDMPYEFRLDLAKQVWDESRHEEANSFVYINNDEAFHVQIGNKWISYLAEINELSEEQLLNVMVVASEKIGIPLFGKGGWNSEIRKLIGL